MVPLFSSSNFFLLAQALWQFSANCSAIAYRKNKTKQQNLFSSVWHMSFIDLQRDTDARRVSIMAMYISSSQSLLKQQTMEETGGKSRPTSPTRKLLLSGNASSKCPIHNNTRKWQALPFMQTVCQDYNRTTLNQLKWCKAEKKKKKVITYTLVP